MQSSQVRNVGLDLVPSTSGPSHDTPKELPLWMLDPKKFPLDWLTFNRSNIVRCTKEYTRELLRWRRCQQYSTASRLKGVLKRIMMFLHTHMRYVDGKNLIDCELEEELITLVSMYADMELKVWLKKRDGLLANGEQAVREYQRRSTNSIAHWLYTMLSEHAHRVDTLLSIQTVYSRHTRPVLDPIFRKVLWEITDTSLTDVTYVRYMLAYKVWHERVLVAEDDASRTLTEHLVNHLVPMNNYTRFSPALRGCLCKTPRNVDNVARFHMIANNINLRKACDDFLKHCRVPLDEINFGSISLIDDDFEDMLSDEDAEVKELMKLISDRQEAKETKNATASRSRDANTAPIVSFVDLTEPEPITQASTSRETSSAAYIDLTSDDDEKPAAQQPSSSSKKPLVAPPAPTASTATKSPMMEACCGRSYREEEDVYMHPNLVNFIFMCPLRRREYGRSKLEIRHMCQETKARCGCMKPAPAEDKHTAKMSNSSFEDMPSCFQFAKTEEFSYMNEDEVDDEDVQPPQVQQQQQQQQALMIKRESLPSVTAAPVVDNVMCNNTSGQEVIDCDADDDESSFCDTLFAGNLTVCDKNNSSVDRTYGKCVSELSNKHVELTCERLQTHTPLKHNSTVLETSPSATKSTPPEANILGTYSRRLSEKLDKRKVLQQQSAKSNSCRREIKFSTTTPAATDDEKTLNCHTHEEIRRIKLPVLESTSQQVQTETSEQQHERVRLVTARDMLNRLTLPQTEPSVSPETGQTSAEIEERLSPEEHLSRAPSPETVQTRRSPEIHLMAETTHTDVLSRLTLPPETEQSVTETERSVAETERTVAETERTVAETERTVAEPERTVAEPERIVTETQRSVAETEISVAETERTVAEPERTVAEPERIVTETQRSVAETERSVAETGRSVIETERTVAEPERSVAETQRSVIETERSVAETESSSVTEKSIPHESTLESIPCPQTETLPTKSEISTNAETLPAEEIHDKRLPETESCIEDVCREVEEIITATEEISVPEHTAEIVVEQQTETTKAEEIPSPTAIVENITEEHPETFSATEVVEQTIVVPSVDTVAENHEILNYETSEVVPEAVPEICVETEIVSNYETPEIILENTTVVSEQIVESFEVAEFEAVAETEVTTESTEEQLPSTENTEEQPETLPNTDLLPKTEESLTVPLTVETEIVENQPEEMTRTQTPETESVEELLDEVTISLAENVDSSADLKEPVCFETEISTETVEIPSSETENLVENISVTETVQENLVPAFPAEILPETSPTEEVHTTEMVELQPEEIIHREIQTSVAEEIFNCDMISEETVITTSYTSETVHEAEIQTEVIFPEECSEIEISSVHQDEKEVSLSVECVIEAETVVSEPVVLSSSVEIQTESVLEFSAPVEQAAVTEKSEKHVSDCLNNTASSKRRRKSPLNKIRKDYVEESQSKIEIEDTKYEEPLASRRRRLSPASCNQLEKITVEQPAHRPEDTVLPSPVRRGRPRKTPSVSRDSHSEDRSSRVVEETDFVGRLRSRRKTDITVEPVTEVLLKEAPGKTEENTETVALTRRRKPGPASSKLRYVNTETLHHESVQPETQAPESISTSGETTPPEQLAEGTDQSVEARSGLKHPKHRRKQTFKAFRSDTDTKTLSKVCKKSESSSDIEARRRLIVTVQNLSEEEISNLMLPVTKLSVVTDKPDKRSHSDLKQHTKRRKHKVPEDREGKVSEVLDKPVEVTEKPAEDHTSDNSTLEEELSLMERLLRTTEASTDKKLKKQRGRKPGTKKRDREHKTTSSSIHSDQKTSLHSDSTVQTSYSSESLGKKASNTDTCSQNTSSNLNLDKTVPASQSSEMNNTISGLNSEDSSIISTENNLTTFSTSISEDGSQKTISSSVSAEAISQKETTQNTIEITPSKYKSTKASVKEYTSIQDNIMIESSHNSEEEMQTAEETQTMLQETSPRLRELQFDESSQDKSLSEDDLPLTCRLENSRLKVAQAEDVAKKLRTSTSSHKSDRSGKTKTKKDLSKSTGESTKELPSKSKRDTSKSLEFIRKDTSKNRRDSSRSTTDNKYPESKKDTKNRKTLNENKNTADKSEQDSSIMGRDTSDKSNQKQDISRRDSLKNTTETTHNPDLSMQEVITSTEVVTKYAEQISDGLKPEDKPEPALQSKLSVSETSRRKKTKSQHPKRDAQHKTSTETVLGTKHSSENSRGKSDNSSKTAKITETDNKTIYKHKAKNTEVKSDVQVDISKIQDRPVDKQTDSQPDKIDTAVVSEPSTPQSTAKVTVSTPALTPSTPKTSAEGSRRRKLKKPVHSQDLKSRDTSLLVTEFVEERKPDQLPQNKVKPIQTSPASSRSKKSSRSTSKNNDNVEEMKKNTKLSDQTAESVKDDNKLSRSSSKTSETNEDVVKDKNLKCTKETKTDRQISDVTELKENTNEKLTIKPFKIESKMKYSAKALKVRQKLSAFAADFSKKRKNIKDPDDIPLTQILVEEHSKFEPAAIVSDEITVNKMSVEETPLAITPTKSTKRKRTRLADIIRPKKSKLSFNVEEKVVKKPRGRPPKFPNQAAIKKELKEVTASPVQPDLDASTLDEINEICQEIQIEIVSEPITSAVVEKPSEPVTNLRLNGLSNIETPTKSVTIEEHIPVKKESHKKGSKINQKEREIAKSLDSDSESNSELVIDTSAETSDEEEPTKMPSKRHWKKEKMYAMKNAQEKIAKSCLKENIQVSVIASSIVTDVVEKVEEAAVIQDCRDEPSCEVTVQTCELTSKSCIATSNAGLSNEEGSNKPSNSQEAIVEPCAVPDIVESLPETKEVIEANNEVIYTNEQITTTDVVSEEMVLEKEPNVEDITTEVSDISVTTDTAPEAEITEELTEITTVSDETNTEVETNTIIPKEQVVEVTAENVTEEIVSLPEGTEITPATEEQVITEEIVISATEIPTTTEEVCTELQSVTESTDYSTSESVVSEETIVSEVVTEKLNVPQELCTETEVVTETVEEYSVVAPETETVEEYSVAAPETEIVEQYSVAAPETETVECSVAASETETVECSVAAPETETIEKYSVAAPETESVEYSVAAPKTETVECSVSAPETETIEECSIAAPETETVERINVASAETESSIDIEEQTSTVSTEVIVEQLQAQEEHKTEENQLENTYNLQQNQDHLQIPEEIVSEAHSKEEQVIIAENQVVEISGIPLPDETVITETSETVTETPASETENTEHQVPETEVPVQQAEISVVHEETVISAVPVTRIPEISNAEENTCVFEDAEYAETDFCTAEMSVAAVLDTPVPERHIAETTSVELEMSEVIIVENTVPAVEISATETQIPDNLVETITEQNIAQHVAVEPIFVRPPPVIYQAEIIEEFIVEDFCTTFELTSPVAEKLVEIVETNPPLTPIAHSMPVILESCLINTQTQKDYREQVAKLATTKCSVNGLQKTNKPIMVRQVELIQHLQYIAETVDELIVPENEVGAAQETLELPECYMTAEASCAQLGTSTQVQAVEKYPPAEIPADENYNLNILAHMAFNLVHLDTKTENNNVLGNQELSLRTDDMCLFVMLPDKQEDTAPNATPVYVQKEGDTEKMVNIQKISTKGAALENKIQHLTELAAKKQPNPPRTAAGENFNDLLTSLEDMLEVDNRKTNTVLPAEPEIPMIIPNTAHLHLIPDDDDFLMHQSAKKSPEKTQECFTLNLSLVSKSASQNKDTKTPAHPLETSVPRDFYNEIENLDLSKTDEKKKTSKEGKSAAKSSKSKSKASKSSPVKPNIEASYLLSKYKSSYDKQSDASAQQSGSSKNVISPPSYIRSTRPMRMVTTRKRKNDTQDKKTSTEEMFDKLLEEHKKEKAAAAPAEVLVVESDSTLEVQKPDNQEIHVQAKHTTVLNSTLMKFPPDSTLFKDNTASGSTSKSPGTAKVGTFSSSFSVASLLPEIASDSTPVTPILVEKITTKPSSTVTIAETSTDHLCSTSTTTISTCSTIISCNTSVTSVPSTLVSSVTSTSTAQSSITSLLSSTSVPIQSETTIESVSKVSPTKTPKSTKKLNILENIAVKIPVPPHDRSRGARLNIRDTLEFVKMPASQEEIRISYVKPAKAVLSTTVDEERNTSNTTSSVNTVSVPEVTSKVNVTGEVTDKPDVIPLPVLEYTVPQPEQAAETSDTKCLIPESVLNRSIEIVEKTIETLKQDNTSQESEVTRQQTKGIESSEIPLEEPIKLKPKDNIKPKETNAGKPDTTLMQDDNSDTKIKIPSDKTDSTPKQDEATEQSNVIVEEVQLIQKKSKPKVKQNLSSAEIKILDETLESKLTHTDKPDSKLQETSQLTEKPKGSVQEQSDTVLASSKDPLPVETAPVVTEVEICTEETVIVEDTVIPSAKEDILAAETVKNQAVEVVTDWFDTKVAPEPYAEVTIEECQFFEEASNSSVISHSQTMGPSSVRKVYSKEYQTPDSGIAFDEDSVQKDKLETLTLADTEGYQSQTSPENPAETTAVPKSTPEPEIFKKPSLIVSIPLSKIQRTIDIIMKAKSELMDETKTDKHKVETTPLVEEPAAKVVDKLRKRKPEPTVVQEVNEESGKISDKLRKRKTDTPPVVIEEPEPSKINEKLRKRKPETPIVEEAKKKRIIAVPEPAVEVDSVKSKKTTPMVPDKPTVTVDDKKKSTKKDVVVVEEVKPVNDVQKSVKSNQEKDAKSLEPVKKDVEKSKKPTETVKEIKKRAQNVVEEIVQVPEVKDSDKIKKKRPVVPEDQADIVVKSEDKSKKRQHSITEDTQADPSTSTDAKDTERVKKKRHNISDHQQTDTTSKEPIVETVKVVDKTKKRTPSASEDSQAENSDKDLPKDSHIDYNWIKKRRPTTIVEDKTVETPEKDPLKNVDWIKKRRSSTTVEKPVETTVKEVGEQPRKRKHSTASDDRAADIASDSSDVLKNVDWIKKRRQSQTETVSTEKDTADLIKKRRQSTVSEKSETSEKEKSVDWIKKRRPSVTDDTQSESEAGVKQDDYLTDKEWSSEEVMSPATSQATPVRSKGSKKEYPDCLFGITESPVPSASCCINSPYPSDISLQEEPTFYVEGGIDLCTDFQDQYYESFDSLKEQQSLQAGYSVVDEARKEQQSLQAGYCVVDSQFTLPEHMNDGDLISMIIENNMIIDKRMVAVNMHQVQPEMKPHAAEEQKRSEFDDFEPDNHLSGIVDGICRNLDSETVEFCQIDPSLLTVHDNQEVQLISMDQANSEVQVVICESLQNMDSTLGTLLFDETANTEITQPGYTITTEPAQINTETVTTTTGDQDAKERVDYPNTALVEELPLCNHEIVIPMTTESEPVVPIAVTEEVIPSALQSEPVAKVQQPSTSYAVQDDVIEATPKAQKPATSFSYIRAKDKKQEEMKKTVKRSTENDLFSFTTVAAATNNKTEKLLKIKLPTSQDQIQVVKTERSPKITSNADRLFENLKSQENIKEQTQKSPRIQVATSPKLISNADRLFDNLKSQKSGPIKVYTPRFASQKQSSSTVKLGVDQKLPEPSPSTSKLSPESKPVKISEPKLPDITPSSPKLAGPKAQEVKVYTKVYEPKKSEPKVNQRRNIDYDFDSLLASGNQHQQRARTPKNYTSNGTIEPTKTGLKSSELNAETYRQRTTSTSSSSSTGEPSKYTFDQRKTTTAGGETSKYNFKPSTPGEPTKYNVDVRRSTRYSPRIQVASASTSRTASGTQKFPSARVPAEEAVSRVPHRTHRSEPVYHMQRLDSTTYYDTNQATEAPTATAAGSTTTAAPTKGVALATNNNKNQPRRRQADEKMWLTNPKLTELVEAANSYYSNKY